MSILTHPRALGGIKNELLSLSNRSGVDGYQQNEEDLGAVGELAEALREAIVEYQVSTSLVRL
jgi:hypothetical protein